MTPWGRRLVELARGVSAAKANRLRLKAADVECLRACQAASQALWEADQAYEAARKALMRHVEDAPESIGDLSIAAEPRSELEKGWRAAVVERNEARAVLNEWRQWAAQRVGRSGDQVMLSDPELRSLMLERLRTAFGGE